MADRGPQVVQVIQLTQEDRAIWTRLAISKRPDVIARQYARALVGDIMIMNSRTRLNKAPPAFKELLAMRLRRMVDLATSQPAAPQLIIPESSPWKH